MLQTIVSPQGQTTVPAQIRKILSIQPGSRLIWQIINDRLGIKRITVTASTLQTITSLKGIAKDMYASYGGGKNYLKKERESWSQT